MITSEDLKERIIIGGLNNSVPSTAVIPNLQAQKVRGVGGQVKILDPITQIGGTCPSFAFKNWLRYISPETPEISALALMYLAVTYDSACNGVQDPQFRSDWAKKAQLEGSHTRSVIGCAQWYGVCEERLHRDVAANAHKAWNVEAQSNAFERRFMLSKIVNASHGDAILAAESGIPCMCASFVFDEIYDPDTRILRGKGKNIGSHVWTLIGIDHETGHLILQSTWGEMGIDGKCIWLVTREYFGTFFEIYYGVSGYSKPIEINSHPVAQKHNNQVAQKLR
jgi:hypothetical protein